MKALARDKTVWRTGYRLLFFYYRAILHEPENVRLFLVQTQFQDLIFFLLKTDMLIEFMQIIFFEGGRARTSQSIYWNKWENSLCYHAKNFIKRLLRIFNRIIIWELNVAGYIVEDLFLSFFLIHQPVLYVNIYMFFSLEIVMCS